MAESEIEKVKKQISAWQSRAEMAQKQGNRELADLALQRKSQYEKVLAELESKT